MYSGSGLTSSGNVYFVTMIVSATGAITGSATAASDDLTSGMSGTVTNAGAASITITSDTGVATNDVSTFSFNKNGLLVGSITNSSSSTAYTYIALAKSGASLPYAGTYTGTFVDTAGNKGTDSITISASGDISGTQTTTSGTVTFVGSVNPSGVTEITSTPVTGAKVVNTGGMSFNPAGELIVRVTGVYSGTTIITTITL